MGSGPPRGTHSPGSSLGPSGAVLGNVAIAKPKVSEIWEDFPDGVCVFGALSGPLRRQSTEHPTLAPHTSSGALMRAATRDAVSPSARGAWCCSVLQSVRFIRPEDTLAATFGWQRTSTGLSAVLQPIVDCLLSNRSRSSSGISPDLLMARTLPNRRAQTRHPSGSFH